MSTTLWLMVLIGATVLENELGVLLQVVLSMIIRLEYGGLDLICPALK